jgi:hypothetical protein
MVALPPDKVPLRVAPPPVTASEPVGVPLDPVTVTVRVRAVLAEIVEAEGVAVNVAGAVPASEIHALTTFATFIDPRPVARSKPALAL